MADIKLTPLVRGILERSTITQNSLTLPGLLSREDYVAVNKVILAAGGKWNKSSGSHLFNGDPRKKLGMILETGVAVDEKKKRQAFYTPKEVAMRVVLLASVQGRSVLEPSAGGGALADEVVAAGGRVDCIEIDEEAATALVPRHPGTLNVDFLKVLPAEPRYQRVVMNPPFTRGQDLKHVLHALKFLRPGGRLVAIMADKDQPALDEFGPTIERLPSGAFKESGTAVSTRIVVIDKP